MSKLIDNRVNIKSMEVNMRDYNYYLNISKYIENKTKYRPKIAIILGSALGSLTDEINDIEIINYADIPNFLDATVDSHEGKLIFGKLNGIDILCMSGRFHYYEGYSFEELSLPMRVLAILGIEKLILTNAAGAINDKFKPGDIVAITDHLNMVGGSPMRGTNIEELGPRFFDITDMYSKELLEKAKIAARKIDIELKEGVYAFAVGPNFETPAEIRAFKALGGDVVGMSTITEALTAVHLGIQVLCFSFVSNMAAGITGDAITVEEVGETGILAVEKLKLLLREIVQNI